jgi:hypothetical protein
LEEGEVGECEGQWYKTLVGAATSSRGCADKTDCGDEGQPLVFGKVNLSEMHGMDGGTLNRVMGGIPGIFGVYSSRRDIEWHLSVSEAGRWWL